MPSTVTVSVLNGTASNGLAGRISNQLTSAGYKQGRVATASDQTRTATIVAYMPGHKPDALAVAKSLKLGPASVQPVDPSHTGRRVPGVDRVHVAGGRDGRHRPRRIAAPVRSMMRDLLDLPDRTREASAGRDHARARQGAVDRGGRRHGRGRRSVGGHRQARLGNSGRHREPGPQAHALPRARHPRGARWDANRARDRPGPARRADRMGAGPGAGAFRDLRRHDLAGARPQARADRRARGGVHGAVRGRLKGRHGRDHAALPLGGDDARRSSRPARGR